MLVPFASKKAVAAVGVSARVARRLVRARMVRVSLVCPWVKALGRPMQATPGCFLLCGGVV